ncbi:phenylacetate--CoA ligase family protein [Arenimonas sp.]|uniref:phenylacetate--CoA ligase family protein n=1 Tax=Arenimonas sp. TaxID=1872635 RepID=UPI0039E720DC
MTTLGEELAEQSRWRARAKGDAAAYDALVANEFDTPDAQVARIAGPLRRLLRICARHVPFYRERFAELGLDPEARDPLETLSLLPVLLKGNVQEHAKALVAEVFAEPSDRIASSTVSSGTTGRPTRVYFSMDAWRMFGVLKQREYRWFRFDPAEKLVSIRLASQLSCKADGSRLADGEMLKHLAWGHVGSAFATGPHLHYNVTNPVDDQLRLLRKQNPRYLIGYPETLEHLAFAAAPESPVGSIRSVLAVSEQLTPGMRRFIARSFGAPIQQNYGLNEIGLVAVRCEAGRYHVHTEHCHVEILDAAGNPVESGKAGRIVVTSLTNTAMPMVRYDTGDLAQVIDGACPCGRTLPAFGEVVGRYSRIAFLPEGTLGLVGTLSSAVEEMPAEHARGLRQIQIHQSRDQGFELRVVATGPLPQAFSRTVHAAWARASADGDYPLAIVQVDEIPRSPGGKFQAFTSDFMPALKPDGGD